MEWSKNAQKFTIGPRFAHASCAVNAKIFIFGGQRKGYLNDLWTWDTAAEEWVNYTTEGTTPAPRVQHTMVFTGKEALVFGGYCENIGEENDLHSLNVLNPEGEFTWAQPQTAGDPPAKRYGHTATMVGTNMIVIAGQDSSSQLGDVWCLETDSYTWKAVDTRGDILLPRTLHSAHYLLSSGLVVLGGFNRKVRNVRDVMILDLAADAASGTWRRAETFDETDAFKGRSQHQGVRQSNHIVIFGGFDGDKPLNDMVVYDADTGTFHAVAETKATPEARCRHTLELVGSDMYCILGYRGDWGVGPEVHALRIGNSEEPISRILAAGE